MADIVNELPGRGGHTFELELREQWFQVYSRYLDVSKVKLTDFLSDIKAENVLGDEVYTWKIFNTKESEVVEDKQLTESAIYGF